MLTANSECFSHEIPNLLRLLLPKSDDPDWLPLEWNWQSFARACDHHHVAALAFCRLTAIQRKTIPPGLSAYLRQRFYETSANNYRLAKELVCITDLLQEHHIPALAYKGPAVAMIAYGDLALRQYQDIDLLIRSKDVGNAVGLLTRRGFETEPFSCQPDNAKQVSRNHLIELAAPHKSYYIDLHWNLAQNRAKAFCPDVDDIWDRTEAIQLPHGRVSTLCREDLFLALCFHGTKHRWCRLKWLIDIVEMLRSADSMDWDRIEKTTVKRPLARVALSLAVQLATGLLDTPVPAAVPGLLHVTERTRSVYFALRDEIFARGYTTVDAEKDLPRLERSVVAWLSYLYRHYPRFWFVHALVRIYPQDRVFVSLPEKLDFLYHSVRPFRLTAKYGMRLARRLLGLRLPRTGASRALFLGLAASRGTDRNPLQLSTVSYKASSESRPEMRD
jgi:hypothetical protein